MIVKQYCIYVLNFIFNDFCAILGFGEQSFVQKNNENVELPKQTFEVVCRIFLEHGLAVEVVMAQIATVAKSLICSFFKERYDKSLFTDTLQSCNILLEIEERLKREIIVKLQKAATTSMPDINDINLSDYSSEDVESR